MKITFKGWKREVIEHVHEVIPVDRTSTGGYRSNDKKDSLEWTSPTHATGRLNDLGLSGDFLVDFEFNKQELTSWLKQLVQNESVYAIKLLSKLQAEAANNIKE